MGARGLQIPQLFIVKGEDVINELGFLTFEGAFINPIISQCAYHIFRNDIASRTLRTDD